MRVGGIKGRAAAVPGSLLAGAANPLTALVAVFSLGLLATVSLGGEAAQLGVRAAFVAVIAGGLVYALLGSTAAPAGGPSSATTLIFAGLVMQLGHDPQLDLAAAPDLLSLLAVLASAVVLMGLLQIVFGLVGLGRIARYAPQPVLAGFMNGVALVIVMAQLPPLLGLARTDRLSDPVTLAHIQPWALIIGLVSAGSACWLSWKGRAKAPRAPATAALPRAPSSLFGLGVGVALYAVLSQLLPGAGLGGTLGALPQGEVLPDALWPLGGGSHVDAARGLWQRHAAAVLLTAFLLALVGSLESLFSALALDQVTPRPHDSRRELMALGAANVASGLCGGMPLSLIRSRAQSLVSSGATGRVGVVVAALTFALIYAAGGELLARLPTAVLAGVMIASALSMIDRWTRQLLRQWRVGERSSEMRWSLSVIAAVGAITLFWGFVAGVTAGVLLSVLDFGRSVNRSLLRERYGADQRPSRRIYQAGQETWLLAARQRVVVFELEGPLFFGNAARLGQESESLGRDCRFLVLDLRRVTTIDESGAMALQQLSGRLAQRGVTLLLAAVTADNRHGKRLRAAGCFREDPRSDWWPDADRAIEAAEGWLLAESGLSGQQEAVPLVDTTLFRGLDAAQRSRLLGVLHEHRLQRGDLLFGEGDPGKDLYVLTEGSVSVVARQAAQGQRFVSFSPGMMFGETAVLDGQGRSATALADTPAVVHALSRSAFDALAAADPQLGQRLALNIAVHLAERLRSATTAWRASAG